ncbi:MAG: hypothetical protein J6A33_03105 [Alphaproteobacteria bacterium]|nr:hypothetical protein [Alphaproteobacteria bacterium]
MFNYGVMPNSAQSASRIYEQQKKEKLLQEQKERLQYERENRRDQVTEEYNQKSLELAEQAKLLSEKSVKFTKLSLWIGEITLLVTTIGAVFTILSYFR